MSLLRVKDVQHKFIRSARRAGDLISFDVRKGEIVGMIGGSGSGKTTLLRIILGLARQQHGEVTKNGIEALDLKSVGVVFQEPAFLPWLTVEDNVHTPLVMTGGRISTKRHSAHQALKDASLDPEKVARLYPDQLSGGMAARVALARAIVNDADLLVLDEPFASVDAYLVSELHMELVSLAGQDRGVLVVSHDLEGVLKIANRLVVLGKYNRQSNPVVDVDSILGVHESRVHNGKFKELRDQLICYLRDDFLRDDK